MVSKSDQKLILIAGGAAIAGYFLLRTAEAGVVGVGQAVSGLPAAIGQIPQAIGQAVAGVPAGIGEAVGGAVGGTVSAIPEVGGGILAGLGEALAPPLRTFEPVPEARQVLGAGIAGVSPARAAYQEAIGTPILTAEQYEALPRGPAQTFEPVVLSPTPALQPPTGWAAGRVVGTRTTGGILYNIIATGVEKEVRRVRV